MFEVDETDKPQKHQEYPHYKPNSSWNYQDIYARKIKLTIPIAASRTIHTAYHTCTCVMLVKYI